jgi:hypothetical protein
MIFATGEATVQQVGRANDINPMTNKRIDEEKNDPVRNERPVESKDVPLVGASA